MCIIIRTSHEEYMHTLKYVKIIKNIYIVVGTVHVTIALEIM
jgi:hypothetical protein